MILNDAAQSVGGARCAVCIFRILVAIIPQQQCICISVCRFVMFSQLQILGWTWFCETLDKNNLQKNSSFVLYSGKVIEI